jgi:hypothetical protein
VGHVFKLCPLFGPKSIHGFIFKEDSRIPPKQLGFSEKGQSLNMWMCVFWHPHFGQESDFARPALYFLGPSNKDPSMRYGTIHCPCHGCL